MKMIIGVLAASLMSFTAFAEERTFGVVEMNAPKVENGAFSVYATDGRIYEIEQNATDLVELVQTAMEEETEVTIELDSSSVVEDLVEKRNQITNIVLTSSMTAEKADSLESRFQTKSVVAGSLMNARITNVSSYYDAERIFAGMRTRLKRKSQCYNRAHVWAWDLYSKRYNGSRIQVGKTWIFFTSKYINQYDYKWWFHIAPNITVNGQEYIMDRTFSKKPETRQEWTNHYMKRNDVCPQAMKYSDYRKNQYSANCFIMKSSVHYWQPHHLKNHEKKGKVQTKWNRGALKKAYRDAVSWFASVPDLRN